MLMFKFLTLNKTKLSHKEKRTLKGPKVLIVQKIVSRVKAVFNTTLT